MRAAARTALPLRKLGASSGVPLQMAAFLSSAPAPDLTAHWDRKYASDKSGASFSWTQTDSMRSLDLVDAELSRMGTPTDAQCVIDVGGGMSGLAKRLIKRHSSSGAPPVHVAIHDISSKALEANAASMTEQERSSTSFECGTILEAKIAPSSVDVWHDRAAFHFFTEAGDQTTYARIAGSSVKSGGAVVLAAFDIDGGPLRCSGLPVKRWGAEELAATFKEAGFSLAHTEREVHTTPGGSSQRFVYVVLLKE